MLILFTQNGNNLGSMPSDNIASDLFDMAIDESWPEPASLDPAPDVLDEYTLIFDLDSTKYELYIHGEMEGEGVLEEEDAEECCLGLMEKIHETYVKDTKIKRVDNVFLITIPEEAVDPLIYPSNELILEGFNRLFNKLNELGGTWAAANKLLDLLTDQEKKELKRGLKEEGYDNAPFLELDLYEYVLNNWNEREVYPLLKNLS